MSLTDHRQAIDQLDAQIVRLLNERTQHVLAIGALKHQNGDEIYAPHRERIVLERVCKHNKGPITDESLRAIYREIMSSALSLEKTMTIAYLGPEATFTHQAALKRFGNSLKYSATRTITDVFQEVARGQADYGVVPVENSSEGVVTNTLDMFVESKLKVVSQIVLPISHCFVSKHQPEAVERLFVHPQTLGQCRHWIQKTLPNAVVVETTSNAESARLAFDEPYGFKRPVDLKPKLGGGGKTAKKTFKLQKLRSAAITTLLAAEKYGLPILEHDIQDNAGNATRFLVLGRQCSPATGKDRTSLMISIADEVGALHKALAPFRRYKLNMTKIESRPSKRKPWEYYFFVDCDGHFEDRKVASAIASLEEHCALVKVLGSYPNSD